MTRTDSTSAGIPSDSPRREIPSSFLNGLPYAIGGSPLYYAEFNNPQHIAEGASIMHPIESVPSSTSSGVPALDKWHHDFLKALNEAAASEDPEFSSSYGTLVSKVENAFRQEERWMEEVGFPMLNVCQEQHARVLGALHNVHCRVMDGDLGLGREVVDQLLPRWFSFHTSTVDATLALALQIAQAEKAPLSDSSIGRYDGAP